MGGRGAASGAATGEKYHFKGKDYNYGDEFETLLEYGNVKFVKIKEGSPTAPLETSVDPVRKPNGRVYVLIGNKNEIKSINMYGLSDGLRYKEIDKGHRHKGSDLIHAHDTYDIHTDQNTRNLRQSEKRFIKLIEKRWKQR